MMNTRPVLRAPRRVANGMSRGLWLLVMASVSALAAAQSPEPPRASLMINVREAPDLRTRIVAVLNKGDPVTVLEERGEFVRLSTRAGTQGYLKHKYLSPYAPRQASQPQPASPSPPPPYRSPYPAEPLAGTPSERTPSGAIRRSGGALGPGAGTPQPGLHLSLGVGALLSTQSRGDLERELAREGFGGNVTRLGRSAPGGFLRLGYPLSPHWQLEAALLYLDDLDLRLRTDQQAPRGLAQSIADHAPATGWGFVPTLAHRWYGPGSVTTLRLGGYLAMDHEAEVRFNGRPLDVDYRTHSLLAGIGWERQTPSGIWGGADLQLMHLNEPVGLLSFSLRFGD